MDTLAKLDMCNTYVAKEPHKTSITDLRIVPQGDISDTNQTILRHIKQTQTKVNSTANALTLCKNRMTWLTG